MLWNSSRDAGSWKVPNRMKLADTRQTTAPGSSRMLPLQAPTGTESLLQQMPTRLCALLRKHAIKQCRIIVMPACPEDSSAGVAAVSLLDATA